MPPSPARSAALSSTFAMPSSARSLANVNTDVSMVRMLALPDGSNAWPGGRINFHHDMVDAGPKPFPLLPEKSALIVVDMQNDFVRVGAPLEVPDARETIEVHLELLDWFRA